MSTVHLTKVITRWHALLGMLLAACLLAGCKPNYPPHERPTLYTTISADGQMVAALDRIGQDRARLRIKRLNDDVGDWQELPVPPYTTSIRFGLQGHQLLLTHHVGEYELADLSRWDLDASQLGPQPIYRADDLAFPIEVAPDEYLVRACDVNEERRCAKPRGLPQWRWLRQDGSVFKYLNPPLWYDWPNIVQGQGFFWMLERAELQADETYPQIRSFAFAGKSAPAMDISGLGQDTANVHCDYRARRCLLRFNYTERHALDPGPYVYAMEVLLQRQRCAVAGVSGYFDTASVTPDGRAAVISVAPAYDQPRHVVVLRFEDGQCAPTSIQHLDLKEK